MPIFSISKPSPFSTLGIWKISESLSELDTSVNSSLFSKFEFIRYTPVKLQKICTALLIEKIHPGLHGKITYTENGKPEILNSTLHISISHNINFSVVLISNIACGVDAELVSHKAEKIKNKFLCPEEIKLLENVDGNQNEAFTLAWCIKESVFKWYAKGNVNFKEHIGIKKMLFNKNKREASVIFSKGEGENKNIRLHLQKFEDCAVAYTLGE
ncbi:4'-phosphopantetheinyl transferase [Flavobacteriales bacterium]|jgi:phosphopantetheinyl transferase (holo-ACP synthase)|nr:hypothetical protein [Flavobacteriales bacterium]WKZ74784.1 MAG: 4'-phosphopantetheinyl transferase superfamily protein [Vicingaceae bacterium]CAG0986186.1 4'-phosphopantetheinyl transferase [Flavobacteriales bacterium]